MLAIVWVVVVAPLVLGWGRAQERAQQASPLLGGLRRLSPAERALEMADCAARWAACLAQPSWADVRAGQEDWEDVFLGALLGTTQRGK